MLSLTQLLIDGLTEPEIQKHLPEKQRDVKGITKLDEFLKENGVLGSEPHIKFMRNLQTLRSSGVGHRKGSNFDKISQSFSLEEQELTTAFEGILRQATDLLTFLSAQLLTARE